MTLAMLKSCDPLLERLAQDLEHMAAKLGQFIQEEDAVMGQRHFAWHWHVAPADQPRIRDGVVGRATRAGRDQRRAVAGEARDAVDTRGLKGLGEGHRRQNGGEPAGQHRLTRPERAKEKEVMRRTPALSSASPTPMGCRRPVPLTHFWSNSQRRCPDHESASSSVLASCRSAVSKPSVNQL